jgi:small subunit ribosomal protein S15
MALAKEVKQEIVKKYAQSKLDTGSSEVQVALLTARINDLSGHFTTHKKDVHSVRGLMKAVQTRRKLLNYLKRTNQAGYEKLIKDLDIRK